MIGKFKKNFIYGLFVALFSTFLGLLIVEIILQTFPNIFGYDIRQQSDVYFDIKECHFT